jgi:hypothetical protein
VDENGEMTMVIEAQDGSARGGQMFDDAMTALGPENVKSFGAKWVTSLPSNLNAFNENLRSGMSMEQAAAQTFTGHMLAKYGITEVTAISTKGTYGNYTNVEVLFEQPNG